VKAMVVRYEKSVANMTVEFEWHEREFAEAMLLALEFLGGDPDGSETARMHGSRLVLFSRGNVLVEIWEKGFCFKPEDHEAIVNGYTYRAKPKQEETS
jgi:hypothetical protein